MGNISAHRWGAVLAGLGVMIALTAQASRINFGENQNIDPDTLGFEIGNGHTLFTNEDGAYALIISEKWEAGKFGEFSEIIVPLTEGTPRARIEISVVKETTLPSGSWTPIKLKNHEGFRRTVPLFGDLVEVEYRLNRPQGGMVVLKVTGKGSNTPNTSFQNMIGSAESFAFLK